MDNSRGTSGLMVLILLLVLVTILVIQGITVSQLYALHHPEGRLVKISERVSKMEDMLEDKAKALEYRIGNRFSSDSKSTDSKGEPSANPAKDLHPLKDWNPFQEMLKMRDQIDRMFGHSLERFQEEPGFDRLWLEKPYMPAADFESKDDHYLVRMDIPGIDKSGLEVSLEGLLLRIKGQREKLIEKKDGEVLRTERLYGEFIRTFGMPGGIDPEKSTAEYKDGVLTVTIPKGEKTEATQKIEVK